MAVALPPPSPQKTASAASRSTSWSRSPSLGGGEKGPEQGLAVLGRCLVAGLVGVEVLAGTPEDLPAVGLALVDDLGDVLVGVVEHLAKQEHGSLDRGEALEQHEEGHREGVGQLSHLLGAFVQVGHDRLGQPGADIGLPANPGRAHVVDSQPGGGRRQIGLGRFDHHPALPGALQPEERFLDQILGLGHAPGHPVGDREHERAEGLFRRSAKVCPLVTVVLGGEQPPFVQWQRPRDPPPPVRGPAAGRSPHTLARRMLASVLSLRASCGSFSDLKTKQRRRL